MGEIGILLTCMRKYTTEDTHSWKEKINPVFDGLIKVYLDFIKSNPVLSGAVAMRERNEARRDK